MLHPQDDTIRVEFPDGDWVEMRRTITVRDRQEAMNKATEWRTARDGSGELTGTFLTGDYSVALLYRMITAWSDDLPINEQTIGALPEAVGTRLMEELNRHNEARTEEERGPLSDGSSPPIEDLAALPRS